MQLGNLANVKVRQKGSTPKDLTYAPTPDRGGHQQNAIKSAYGYERTFWPLSTMSAVGGKKDMPLGPNQVRK